MQVQKCQEEREGCWQAIDKGDYYVRSVYSISKAAVGTFNVATACVELLMMMMTVVLFAVVPFYFSFSL